MIRLFKLLQVNLFQRIHFDFYCFSFSDGYWLTSLTLTSLAYGDLYPTHIMSRILMLICSLIGLILITLPIPKVFYYFNRLYRNEKKKRHIIRYIYSDQTELRI